LTGRNGPSDHAQWRETAGCPGNPVYRIRGDRVVDINTGNPVYRMRE